jgi:hypothetical protein
VPTISRMRGPNTRITLHAFQALNVQPYRLVTWNACDSIRVCA